MNGQAFLDVAYIDSKDLREDKSRLHNLDWIPDEFTNGIRTYWQKTIEMTVLEASQKAAEKKNSVLTAENVSKLRKEQKRRDGAEIDKIIQEMDPVVLNQFLETLD